MNIYKMFKKVHIARIELDREKFKKQKEGSCMIKIHPCLHKDLTEEEQNTIKKNMEEITDILRNNIKNVDLI